MGWDRMGMGSRKETKREREKERVTLVKEKGGREKMKERQDTIRGAGARRRTTPWFASDQTIGHS
jgi:hypothetical protein